MSTIRWSGDRAIYIDAPEHVDPPGNWRRTLTSVGMGRWQWVCRDSTVTIPACAIDAYADSYHDYLGAHTTIALAPGMVVRRVVTGSPHTVSEFEAMRQNET